LDVALADLTRKWCGPWAYQAVSADEEVKVPSEKWRRWSDKGTSDVYSCMWWGLSAVFM